MYTPCAPMTPQVWMLGVTRCDRIEIVFQRALDALPQCQWLRWLVK